MTLNAAHNGNLGMLRSYMASDEVRRAMVDKGVTDETNSKADQQKALDKIDEVTASYEAELKKLVNLSEAVRVTKHTDDILPIEFFCKVLLVIMLLINNTTIRLIVKLMNLISK